MARRMTTALVLATKRLFVLRSPGHIPRPGDDVVELTKGPTILLDRHLRIL